MANLTDEQIKAWLNTQNALYGTDASQGNQITGVDPRYLSGFAQSISPTQYQYWDAQGNDKGVQTRTPDSWLDKNMGNLTLAAIAAMTGAGLFGDALGIGGSASANAGAGLGAGGSDLATSAAWGGGAGLGGDTLTAIGAGGVEAGAAGGGALSKAVLDGTTAFGANSVPGAIDVGSYAGTAVPGAVDLGSAGGVVSTGATGGLLANPVATTAATGAGTAAGLGSAVTGAGKVASGLLSNPLTQAAIVAGGAALGSKPTTSTGTQQSNIDPRMAKFIYGDGSTQGILDQAYQWQQANKSGLNDPMKQGLFTINQVASDPGGYQSIAKQGLSLMNQPVAGNPFTNGQATLQTGTPQALKNLGFK